MQDSSGMKNNLASFQNYVRELSQGIAGLSGVWNDEKYSELSKAFNDLANDSKSVLENGLKCCTKLDNFMSIAREKY